MEQLHLPLLGRLDAPSVAPTPYVEACQTYRQAVRLAWQMRRARRMTQRMLAIEAELRPQLVSDYLTPDDRSQRKSLPAERIASFESIVGNTQARAVRDMAAAGVPDALIAGATDVGIAVVADIRRGRAWTEHTSAASVFGWRP